MGRYHGNLIRWNVYARPELLAVGRDSRVTSRGLVPQERRGEWKTKIV